MKEVNVAFVYILCLIIGTEIFSVRSGILLVFIVLATVMTVHGELRFSPWGFAIQVSSSICEVGKIVLQGLLLAGGPSASGPKLDPLTYVLIVSPLCFGFLGALLVCHCLVVEIPVIDIPTLATIMDHSGILVMDALIALALNLTTATFIRCTSAVAFTLVSIAKDTTIVIFSALLHQNNLSTVQTIGFSVQLPLILLYAFVKTSPDTLEERPLMSKIGDAFFTRKSSGQTADKV
jgi:hypothetical protein